MHYIPTMRPCAAILQPSSFSFLPVLLEVIPCTTVQGSAEDQRGTVHPHLTSLINCWKLWPLSARMYSKTSFTMGKLI